LGLTCGQPGKEPSKTFLPPSMARGSTGAAFLQLFLQAVAAAAVFLAAGFLAAGLSAVYFFAQAILLS